MKVSIAGKSYSGGNPYHPRDTPQWQKPITCFINQNSSKDAGDSSEAQVYYALPAKHFLQFLC